MWSLLSIQPLHTFMSTGSIIIYYTNLSAIHCADNGMVPVSKYLYIYYVYCVLQS